MSRAVTLEPYAKQVTVVSGGHAIRCSYREAISTPRIAAALSAETITTITASLEAAQ